MGRLKIIYFAGGCFWGIEEFFSRISGVTDATSGYANGTLEDPRYAAALATATWGTSSPTDPWKQAACATVSTAPRFASSRCPTWRIRGMDTCLTKSSKNRTSHDHD